MGGSGPQERTTGADELASGTEGASSISPWVWRLAGLLVVIVVAVVAGPDLLSSSAPTGRDQAAGPSADESSGADVVPPIQPRPAEPLRWATRGEGAGSVFGAAALQRLGQEQKDVDRLLWSGTLDGTDHVALVALKPRPDGSNDDGIDIAALRVGPGDVLATTSSSEVGAVRGQDGIVAAAWRDTGGRTRMIVLGRPVPLDLQVSSAIDYHPDGSISRHWRHVDADDGAAVLDLGRHADRTVVVRPRSSSAQSAFLVPVVSEQLELMDDLVIAGLDDPSYAGPDPDTLITGVTDSLNMVFDARNADARVVWSGLVRGGDDETFDGQPAGRGALVRLRRPDGAVFQSFVFMDRSGDVRTTSANPVPWSVGDLLPCTFSTFEPGSPLLLLNPSGKGSVTVSMPSMDPIRVATDANGVGVLWDEAGTGPNFGGARVVVRDVRGHVVLRSALVDEVGNDGFGSYL